MSAEGRGKGGGHDCERKKCLLIGGREEADLKALKTKKKRER